MEFCLILWIGINLGWGRLVYLSLVQIRNRRLAPAPSPLLKPHVVVKVPLTARERDARHTTRSHNQSKIGNGLFVRRE